MTRPLPNLSPLGAEPKGLLAAGLAGLTLASAFPDFGLWPLAWVAPGLLLVTLHGARPLEGAIRGWLFGLSFYGVTVWWVDESMTVFGGLPPSLGALVTFLLAATMGLYTALFAGLFCRMAVRFGYRRALTVAPFLWVAVEFLRERFPDIGFPWGRLGDSQYLAPPLIQIVDLAGVEGLSFLMIAFSGAMASATMSLIRRDRMQAGIAFGVAALLLAGNLTYGYVRLSTFATVGERIVVAALQGNIDQHRKWDPDYASEQLDGYVALTKEVVAKGADLVIWPETAAPWYVGRHPRFDERVRALSATTGVPIIFGAPAEGFDDAGKRMSLNRAWSVDPMGAMHYYDKVKLAPFGEYVPFARFLFFVRKLTRTIGHIQPGETLAPLPAGEHTVGVQICFEAIFPAYSRALTADGAELLAIITNDSWFGDTASSEQALAMGVMRGVENRIPMVRAAQSGISAIVNADGTILDRTELFTTGYAIGAVTLRGEKGALTPFTQTGDLFRWLSVLLTASALVAARRPKE